MKKRSNEHKHVESRGKTDTIQKKMDTIRKWITDGCDVSLLIKVAILMNVVSIDNCNCIKVVSYSRRVSRGPLRPGRIRVKRGMEGGKEERKVGKMGGEKEGRRKEGREEGRKGGS